MKWTHESKRNSKYSHKLVFSLNRALCTLVYGLKKLDPRTASQPRSFTLKKETSHVGREKPPNPVPRPHTEARNPVSGPVRKPVLWEIRGRRGDFFSSGQHKLPLRGIDSLAGRVPAGALNHQAERPLALVYGLIKITKTFALNWCRFGTEHRRHMLFG
jgi:hypothetical protein